MAKTGYALIFVAGAIAFFFWALANHDADVRAVAAGYESADDMNAAWKAGFREASAWRAALEKERATQARLDRYIAGLETASRAEKELRERYFQEGLRYARALKQRMKNPASFRLEGAMRTADGIFCFDYRASNSFNAIVPGHAFVGPSTSGTSDDGKPFVSLWEKHCSQAGQDFATIASAINEGY